MKRNALQILMTAVLAFAFTGAIAQLNDPAGDFNSTDTEATHQVTVNKYMPFWVEPDTYFNPGFETQVNGLTGYGLVTYLRTAKTEVNSTFNWSVTGGGTATPQNEAQNYVEYSFDATGSYTLTVEEVSSTGSCPGTPVTMTVEVVAEPAITDVTIPATNIDACEGAGSLTTAINATLSGTAGNMHLTWDYRAYTVSSDWDGTTFPAPAGVVVDADISAEAGYTIVDNTDPADPFIGVNASNELVAERTFTSYDSKITIYEFEMLAVNDKVSRNSDYLSLFSGTLDNTLPENYTYYTNNNGTTRYIVVRPAPTTGPIYHISNDWGL